MESDSRTRRRFLTETAAAGGITLLTGRSALAAEGTPALLGGAPAHMGDWPAWPETDAAEEEGMVAVIRSGSWYRYRPAGMGDLSKFEAQWARIVGTTHCLAIANGTSALMASLAGLGIGPGDEVLVSPYTFIATVNSILAFHALPVFVDSDPETAMLDAERIAERITGDTKAIIPVHIGGAPFHVDHVLAIARAHGLTVIEDACQAHTGEWKGQRVGSFGDTGCFSFQNSKNLTSGEGGALTTNDDKVYARVQAYHSNSRRFDDDGLYTTNGVNLRLTQFQGALLNRQLPRLEAQSRRREANGAYLDTLLAEIPGIRPKKTYAGVTRHGYHLYMWDYDPDAFAGMSKMTLRNALAAEGIPASRGYTPINKQPFVEQFLNAKGFRRIYSAKRLQQWRQTNDLPGNDRLCATNFWFGQTTLLASRTAMEQIAAALRKIQKHAAALARV